ncbi:MAG TPA: DUF4440 domain-containing protein [Pyrinomonadaceae bacterium]
MSELSEQDLKAIEELHNHWIAEELVGAATQVITLCTKDIKWIPPDSPPLKGKEAITAYISANTVGLKDVQISDVEISGTGTLAYLTSRYCSQFSAEGFPETQQATGTHLWILRKESDGIWRVAVVAWSAWETTLI